VPDSDQIDFNPDGAWAFPEGTVLVKHFEITTPATERLRLETRVFTHSVAGWQGVSYRWNETQTDAELIVDAQTQRISRLDDSGTIETFDYVYPSRAECLSCHTAAAGRALGVSTRQLNRQFDYPTGADNQLASFARVGLISSPTGTIDQLPTLTNSLNEAATLQARARSYLDVNCANCHRPRGPTGTTLDLRLNTPNTALNAIGVSPDNGDLGISNARIIAAGDPAASVLLQRMRRLDDERMPPITGGSNDTRGSDLISAWIETL
jgi:uncharacterized repeat protein (TIGR03806 family)